MALTYNFLLRAWHDPIYPNLKETVIPFDSIQLQDKVKTKIGRSLTESAFGNVESNVVLKLLLPAIFNVETKKLCH